MKAPAKEEVQKILEKTLFAQALSKKEIDLLAGKMKVISFAKGETIFKQGSVISDYAVLMTGMCKTTVENPSNGNGTIISFIKPIDIIGIWSLEDTVFAATATALADSVVVFFDKKDVSQLMLTNGKFCYRIFETLCSHARKTVRQSVDFSQKSIMSRVASSLLYIMGEITDGDCINLPISRNDLAEYSGIATGSTIRLLRELEKANVVLLDKKTIWIKDIEALKKISLQD